jgi:hypothetical protein
MLFLCQVKITPTFICSTCKKVFIESALKKFFFPIVSKKRHSHEWVNGTLQKQFENISAERFGAYVCWNLNYDSKLFKILRS